MVRLPQSLLEALAQETDPEKIQGLLDETYYMEMEALIKQFNKNTGILLYDFRGILMNIGAKYE